ncbi:MAG: hypothetical protein J5I47_01860 [Vicingus serpentipes]|nr:hypothetical protein [Vicingus serpentipes]
MANKKQTYFEERMAQIGVTEDNNLITYTYDNKGNHIPNQFDIEGNGHPEVFDANNNIINCAGGRDFKIFEEDEHGNICINYLNKFNNKAQWKKPGRKFSENYQIKRYKVPVIDPKTGQLKKYHLPKGAGSFPFLPPKLIEKYQKAEPIKNLFLTEGAIKAFKASINDIDIVGLTSITHYKDKTTGTIHGDIIDIITRCQVQNVFWLVDGDCLDISDKYPEDKEIDLYKRPNIFFNSVRSVQKLLTDYDVNIYFAHVISDSVEGSPKGLDDLIYAKEQLAIQEVERHIAKGIIKKNDRAKEIERVLNEVRIDIVSDLNKVSTNNTYIHKIDVTHSFNKLRAYYHLKNVNGFYEFHKDRIGSNEFIWNGTKYKYDEEKNECEVIIPAAARNYFRVGDQYHEWVEVPNKHGQIERRFDRRLKSTITDDHGKKFVDHILKLKAFCNVPDHENYQPIIRNCMNVYQPFTHEPLSDDVTEEDISSTLHFLKHIFGSNIIKWRHPKTGKQTDVNELDLGLDYVQLLYQKPTQILPIVCLVSKENNTGKSTFAKWLKLVFEQNMAIVGNADLQNDFNAFWATKLIVCCDEAFIEKKVVVEKIKSLSTADKITMNQKGKDQSEIDFFGKFLLLTNNEDNFIYASEDDVRFWVRKIPKIPPSELNVDVLAEMQEEIPAFLKYLSKRKLSTENLHRAWFDAELIKTDALRKVIEYSRPTIEKEIRAKIKEMFLDFDLEEIQMTTKDLKAEFFKNSRYEDNYIAKVLSENLNLERYKNEEGKEVTKRHSYPKFEKNYEEGRQVTKQVEVQTNGRPWVFKREDFVTQEELEAVAYEPENAHISDFMSKATQITLNDDLPFD